jgi:acyl-CoA dehydrogenase
MLVETEKASLLDEVRRFASGAVAELTLAGERAPDAASLQQLTREAQRIGILPHPEESGFGLWELAGNSAGLSLHLEMLLAVARSSAGLALDWHQRSLATGLARSGGSKKLHDVTIALDGRGGLARYSLARFLRGGMLETDEEMLTGYFYSAAAEADRFYMAMLKPSPVFIPTYTNGSLEWLLLPASACSMQPVRVHGLDHVMHYRVSINAGVEPLCRIDALLPGFAHYVQVLTLYQAGLLAIQTGVAEEAVARALQYARVRQQGGSHIGAHPAVQELLMTAQGGVNLARAVLSTLPVPDGLTQLADVMEKRAALQDHLYTATTNALQVFGGYGYMQDYLVERFAREQNQLSLLGGSAAQARLFLAELRELNKPEED